MPAVLSKNADRCLKRLRILYNCKAGFAAKELGEAKTEDLKERTLNSFIIIVTKADINADAKELKCDPLDAKEADLLKKMLLQWGRENSDGVSVLILFYLLYYCYDRMLTILMINCSNLI